MKPLPKKQVPKKFEKVNDYTLRIILEETQEVPVTTLLANKKLLTEQKTKVENQLKEIDKVLGNINEMLAEAKKLGIAPEPKKVK